MATCNFCSVHLDDTNWVPSLQKSNTTVCKHCWNERYNNKNNPRHNPNRIYLNGVYQTKKSPVYNLLPGGRYKSLDDALFQTSPVNDIKEGYVYIITNKAWPDWIKIGMAIDAQDRCNSYQTSSPFRDYVLEHFVHTDYRREAEKEAHTKAAKLASETNGEWFKLDVETAKQILDNLHEHGRRATEETNTDTQEDELQERPEQADLWSYAENRKAS